MKVLKKIGKGAGGNEKRRIEEPWKGQTEGSPTGKEGHQESYSLPCWQQKGRVTPRSRPRNQTYSRAPEWPDRARNGQGVPKKMGGNWGEARSRRLKNRNEKVFPEGKKK